MILCTDVQYSPSSAWAAAVGFESWPDAAPSLQLVHERRGVLEYQPGEFYRRELLPLLELVQCLSEPPELLVIDAYCHLSPELALGLGARLYEALGGEIPIIGVAKTRYSSATQAVEALRGGSQRPLYITAIGLDPNLAARQIQSMHGSFRLPTLLKLADSLARRAAA
jgi:deoxyribonuclease V